MKSKRPCGGYGLRLTWPRQGDCTRSTIVTLSKHKPRISKSRHEHWINVCQTDMRLHFIANKPHGKDNSVTSRHIIATKMMLVWGKVTREQLTLPLIPDIKPGILDTLGSNEHYLLVYCNSFRGNIQVVLALTNRS